MLGVCVSPLPRPHSQGVHSESRCHPKGRPWRLCQTHKKIFLILRIYKYMKVGTLLHHMHLQKKKIRKDENLANSPYGWLTTILLSFNYKQPKSSSMIGCSPRWPSAEFGTWCFKDDKLKLFRAPVVQFFPQFYEFSWTGRIH